MDTAPGHSTIPDRTSYQPQATSVRRRLRTNCQRNRGQDGFPYAKHCVPHQYMLIMSRSFCPRDVILGASCSPQWCASNGVSKSTLLEFLAIQSRPTVDGISLISFYNIYRSDDFFAQ